MRGIYEKKYSRLCGRDTSLFGAFSCGDTIDFTLTPLEKDWQGTLVIHGDGWGKEKTVWMEYPLHAIENGAALTLSMGRLRRDTGGAMLLYYHYRVLDSEGHVTLWGGESPMRLSPVEDGRGERQLLLYSEKYSWPEGLEDGIIYHIFVDRFHKTGAAAENQKPGTILNPCWENGIPQYGAYPGADVANNVFFGGDLWGVAEKLDYLASLGTGTIYLSPIFTAASNHKYDTSDYLSIDPMFGGEEALRHLCREAGHRGIRVILDGVFNHTGSDSIYFNKDGNYPETGAYQSQDSPYWHWYNFQDFPDTYDCWWGVKILPRVNSFEESYRKFICERVVPKWMQMGVSGWRLDVVDELSQSFLVQLRQAVLTENQNAVLIGEVWEDASDKVAYGERRQYFMGEQMDGVMNYPLREAILSYVLQGDTDSLRRGTEYLYRRYPKWASDRMMNFLGTHDTIRILTALGGEPQGNHTNEELAHLRMTQSQRHRGIERLKTAYGLLVAMPGVPCVFYGDEVGMEGYRDPFCRCPFPWHDMDQDLLAYYRRIGQIRRNESLLRDGLFWLLSATEDGALMARTPWHEEQHQLIIAVNRSEQTKILFAPVDVWECITDTPMRSGEIALEAGRVVYLRCGAEVEKEKFCWVDEASSSRGIST